MAKVESDVVNLEGDVAQLLERMADVWQFCICIHVFESRTGVSNRVFFSGNDIQNITFLLCAFLVSF